jgi:hypothetical protein
MKKLILILATAYIMQAGRNPLNVYPEDLDKIEKGQWHNPLDPGSTMHSDDATTLAQGVTGLNIEDEGN